MKSARRLEPRAKRLELQRRHRLQDVELRHQHFQDGENALERVLDPMQLARVEQLDHVIDFVQHLLEPQLVDLVNDDEEHFVVFGSLGARPLQREQFVDGQVAPVGDGTVVHDHSLSGTGLENPCSRSRRVSIAWIPSAVHHQLCKFRPELRNRTGARIRHVACSTAGRKFGLPPQESVFLAARFPRSTRLSAEALGIGGTFLSQAD